jgi:uncharacterized membrane protein YciS (DUF1049 family)
MMMMMMMMMMMIIIIIIIIIIIGSEKKPVNFNKFLTQQHIRFVGLHVPRLLFSLFVVNLATNFA